MDLEKLIREEFFCREAMGRLLEFSDAHRIGFDRLMKRLSPIEIDPCVTAFEQIVKSAILVEEAKQ